MDLSTVKKQVELMIRSISSLGLPDRKEALKFLKECSENFGLVIPEEKVLAETGLPSLEASENNSLSSHNTNDNKVHDNEAGTEIVLRSHQKNESDLDNNVLNCPKMKLNDIKPKKENGKFKCMEKYNRVREAQNKTKRIKKKRVASKTEVPVLNNDVVRADSSIGHKVKEKSKEESLNIKANTDCDFFENDNEIFRCPGCMIVCETKSLLSQHFATHGKSPMSCRMCRASFSNMAHFWKHQKNKECKLPLLKCSECGEKFKYRRHYLKHVLGHNDNNCRYCDEKFSTWVLYKQHLKEKHPDIKMERDLIPCKFCAMSFRRHLGLYNHYQMEHSKGKFVCLSCGLLLPTKEKFKEHALVHESEKTWKCQICKMKFYRRQQLLFHVSVHKSGTYKCLTCDITVTSKVDLYKHKREGHEVKGLEPKFECEICHKNFNKRVVLNNHMATHSKERKYYCKHCVKSFRTMDALQKHQKRKSHFEKAKIILPESKYEKVYEDKLICESCGKQYKTQRELTWHRRVHKTIYECEECGKTFTLKVNLTKHIRLHRNKVCVVCELCGNTFNQLSALNEHILMKHSDVRNAECEVCKKKFKRKSELNRHMRIHEQKRPFACFCGTAFKQSGHLQTHYRTFHAKSNQQQQPQEDQSHSDNLMPPESFTNPAEEVYGDPIHVDRRKQMYVNGEQGTLLNLANLDTGFRNSNSFETMQVSDSMADNNYGLRYTQGEMEPINVTYEELNFESAQPGKRELVFSSPAIDLSMVTIPEVVENDITLSEARDIAESVENFNKLPDDASNLQLVNLSEHIVQEYLLNLS